MKLFRMLARSIRDAFKSVIRNFSLSLASISCITITLIIVALAIIASMNVQNFTKEIEKDMTIVVFLDNDTDEEEAKIVENKISKMSNVSKYTFQVKVKNIEKIKSTAEQIEKIKNVSVVRYGEGMVDKMVTAFSSIEKVTYGIVIALILVTIFLIINTIKLTISARKREISIMRLVGASNFTIKTPFIIEGMILGMFGSIVPILITMYGYTAFYKHFNGYLFSELIKLIVPEPFIYQTSLAILGIGILVGMIGSASAVRKYLKI